MQFEIIINRLIFFQRVFIFEDLIKQSFLLYSSICATEPLKFYFIFCLKIKTYS